MNALPVIDRELRAQSRQSFTYWLRVLGGSALSISALFVLYSNPMSPMSGSFLFMSLHVVLMMSIWVLVPMLAADSLSRERREGTLGLLFLTPLKAWDIVVAKSLVHGLRALTLLMAAIPVVMLPFLMGGVSWRQAVVSLCFNGASLCIALSAGLLASALSKSWIRALILSFSIAALGLVVSSSILRPEVLLMINPVRFRGVSGPQPAPIASGLVFFGLSILILLVSVSLAASQTRCNWQERPPNPLAVWAKHKFCTPVLWQGFLRRWMQRKLARNPIGWLEQRTWSGRLVIWSWFAVLISVYSLVLTDASLLTRNFTGIHTFMASTLLASLALSAATSFRRERETRVLELLLVSPLSERQLIMGRLFGLWGQFLPSMILLLAGWTYLSFSLNHQEDFGRMVVFAATFVVLPVVGLYFSLICRSFLTALLWTVLLEFVAPMIVTDFMTNVGSSFGQRPGSPVSLLCSLLLQAINLATFGVLLHRCLVNRRFVTDTN